MIRGVQLDAALAVDALSVVVKALTSLVARRRDVTSRAHQSRRCQLTADPVRPAELGHVVNDHLRRVRPRSQQAAAVLTASGRIAAAAT